MLGVCCPGMWSFTSFKAHSYSKGNNFGASSPFRTAALIYFDSISLEELGLLPQPVCVKHWGQPQRKHARCAFLRTTSSNDVICDLRKWICMDCDADARNTCCTDDVTIGEVQVCAGAAITTHPSRTLEHLSLSAGS